MQHKTYTQEEVTRALNILKREEQDLLSQRTELNKKIKEKRKNIKLYENMDFSQYKAF